MRKIISFLLLAFLTNGTIQAQGFKLPNAGGSFSDSLNRIISDFRNNFSYIQDKELQSDGSVKIFLSKVCLPGAFHCTITRYNSIEDHSASWTAVMYEGENYDQAVKTYKSIYEKVKKSHLRTQESGNASFSGEWEKPDENVSFAVSLLKLESKDPFFKDFYAQVELNNVYNGWEVHLSLMNKKNDASAY